MYRYEYMTTLSKWMCEYRVVLILHRLMHIIHTTLADIFVGSDGTNWSVPGDLWTLRDFNESNMSVIFNRQLLCWHWRKLGNIAKLRELDQYNSRIPCDFGRHNTHAASLQCKVCPLLLSTVITTVDVLYFSWRRAQNVVKHSLYAL